MADIKFEIVETIIVFPESSGWHKELNLIKWNDRDPKYDLRIWNEDNSKMGKGITLTEEELKLLADKLQEV